MATDIAELVEQDLRANGFIPPPWKDEPKVIHRVLERSRCELGNDGHLFVKEHDADHTWCYFSLCGVSGGQFVAGNLKDGKQQIGDIARKMLMSALAALDNAGR